MPQIGIYSVDSTELSKPPSERKHEQKGLYHVEERTWSPLTDSRIEHILPATEKEYSVEEIQEAVETSTTHVYLKEEVPGTVTKPTSSGTCFGLASD